MANWKLVPVEPSSRCWRGHDTRKDSAMKSMFPYCPVERATWDFFADECPLDSGTFHQAEQRVAWITKHAVRSMEGTFRAWKRLRGHAK